MAGWVRLELDVERFDDTAFEPYLQRARTSGTRFTTMVELGDTAQHRRALYELNKACSADIPDRGAFYTYAEYVTQRIDVATFDPGGVVLATRNGAWIGMSTTSLHPDKRYAFSEMTGVLAPHRGQGLSLALKLLAIRFVRSSGYQRLVAFHHPRNTAAIAMNRRLGFVDLPARSGPTPWQGSTADPARSRARQARRPTHQPGAGAGNRPADTGYPSYRLSFSPSLLGQAATVGIPHPSGLQETIDHCQADTPKRNRST